MLGTHPGVPLGPDKEGAAPPRTTRTAPEDVCRARRVGTETEGRRLFKERKRKLTYGAQAGGC